MQFDNLTKFSKRIGKYVAKQAGYSRKQLNSFIRLQNVQKIVKTHSRRTFDGKYEVDEEEINLICEEIFDWLVGVELCKLAADDVIGCYWDDKKNRMEFITPKEKEDEEV
tara:strand:+ start:283 stop:612 length:330 start_codon:yes stop_codon:yes gene_type:complete